MSYDWIMRVFIKTTYKNGESDYLTDYSNEGCKGIYLSYDTDDSDADVQMKEWKSICPDTLLYENGIWHSILDESTNIIYATTPWCGCSIKYTKTRILEIISNFDNVIKIEAIPYAEKRY